MHTGAAVVPPRVQRISASGSAPFSSTCSRHSVLTRTAHVRDPVARGTHRSDHIPPELGCWGNGHLGPACTHSGHRVCACALMWPFVVRERAAQGRLRWGPFGTDCKLCTSDIKTVCPTGLRGGLTFHQRHVIHTWQQDSLPEWSEGVDSSSTNASCVGSNATGVIQHFMYATKP